MFDSFEYIFHVGGITRCTLNSESMFASKFCAQEIAKRLNEQTQATLTILGAGWETCLVDAAVGGFNTSPKFERSETTQNVVGIATLQELVVCFGNILRFRLWSRSTPISLVVT